MGALNLPATGSIYIDANIVIYAVEKIEPYHSFLSPLWQVVSSGTLCIVTSELTWLETLTKPIRDGNYALETIFHSFLTAREVQLIPSNLAIWEQAARLRSLGLKTPDALHAATGIAAGCSLFLTNNLIFSRVPGLPVSVLNIEIAK